MFTVTTLCVVPWSEELILKENAIVGGGSKRRQLNYVLLSTKLSCRVIRVLIRVTGNEEGTYTKTTSFVLMTGVGK